MFGTMNQHENIEMPEMAAVGASSVNVVRVSGYALPC